jgi:hypothetical protein
MATVTGTIKVPSVAVYRDSVTFEPLSTPFFTTGKVLYGTRNTVIYPVAGAITVTLAEGTYRVILSDGADSFQIVVPTGTGSYDLYDIIDTSSVPVFTGTNFRVIDGVLCLKNRTTGGFNPIYSTGTWPLNGIDIDTDVTL